MTVAGAASQPLPAGWLIIQTLEFPWLRLCPQTRTKATPV